MLRAIEGVDISEEIRALYKEYQEVAEQLIEKGERPRELPCRAGKQPCSEEAMEIFNDRGAFAAVIETARWCPMGWLYVLRLYGTVGYAVAMGIVAQSKSKTKKDPGNTWNDHSNDKIVINNGRELLELIGNFCL